MAVVQVTPALGGTQTAPSIPASANAFTNPFGRACLVQVSGGTVTAIAVSGTTVGLLAGTFVVPAGGTITLTYAVAPTWTWMAL